MEALKKNKVILIYTRPWFSDFYKILGLNFEKIFNCKVVFFSDYEMPGTFNFSPNKRDIPSIDEDLAYKTPLEYYDIIKRDRLLRRIKKDKALSILNQYNLNIENFFQQYDVKFVFSATVDQFAIDLCYRYCILNSIPFIGYHMSVIPGYTLLTARGESIFFRKIDNKEIEASVNKISPKDFRPDYIPSKNALTISGIIRVLKNFIRIPLFFIKDLLSKKYNYHYKWNILGSLLLIRLRNITPIFKKYEAINQDDIFDIYIPLQFHPECNSDYWGRSSRYESYLQIIINFCYKYADEFRICVKEHPNMVGLRPNNFYKELSNIGVTIIDVKEDNKDIIRSSKVVVTYNSSVGIEGLVYGAYIYCMTNAYYLTDGHIQNEADLLKHLRNTSSKQNLDLKSSFLNESVSQTLSMSLPGILPDISVIKNNTHKKELEDIANSFSENLKKYLKVISAKEFKINEVYTYKKQERNND